MSSGAVEELLSCCLEWYKDCLSDATHTGTSADLKIVLLEHIVVRFGELQSKLETVTYVT